METDTFLIIVAWTGIALCLVGIGIVKTKKQASQHSQIFEPGNEHWAEMDAWIKK